MYIHIFPKQAGSGRRDSFLSCIELARSMASGNTIQIQRIWFAKAARGSPEVAPIAAKINELIDNMLKSIF